MKKRGLYVLSTAMLLCMVLYSTAALADWVWADYTDDTYWGCGSNCGEWDGTKWTEAGPGLSLNVTGLYSPSTWARGFKPTKVRVTYSGYGSPTGATIGVGFRSGGIDFGSGVVDSGEELALVNANNIERINLYGTNTVSKIEFYIEVFSGLGLGTDFDPYQITDCNQLQEINLDSYAYYKLMKDIDCSDTINWNGGDGFEPLSSFYGQLDGNGKKIMDLYINMPDKFALGLFVGLGDGGEIIDVGLENIDITGRNYVGGLVGRNWGFISDSYTTGKVNGASEVGGLVGKNVKLASISDSYSTASVAGTNYVGGLVGRMDISLGKATSISNSYSAGSVIGTNYVGGLVGSNRGAGSAGDGGSISDCYSTASVTGTDYVGGLVGAMTAFAWGPGSILNSYSAGLVSGTANLGGLIGYDAVGATVTSSYWDTLTSAQPTSSSGTGKTTVEMKQQATFLGWDFNNVWTLDEGVGYPDFKWNTPPVTDTDGDTVNDDVDNCINEFNPDQTDTDNDCPATPYGSDPLCGDACDICPDAAADSCDPLGSGGAYITSSTGGLVVNSYASKVAGYASFDVPAGALEGDTSMSMTKEPPVDSNVQFLDYRGAVAVQYSLTPDGISFPSILPVTVTLVAECTKMCSKWQIWAYDTNNQQWEPLATTATNIADTTWQFQADTTHFTLFGLIEPLDSDGDGWLDFWCDEYFLNSFGQQECEPRAQEVDCGPEDPDVNPGAPEVCNGKDDDCDIRVDEGCPLADKESALALLESLNTSDSKSGRELEKSIAYLIKSLGNIHPEGDKKIMWLDESHLYCKNGKKVFDNERKAVEHLERITDASILGTVNEVISLLINIDKKLAQTAIDEAPAGKDKERAIGDFSKGDSSTESKDKIKKYGKAWEDATKGCHKKPKEGQQGWQ